MKNVVVITASPRKNSNSTAMAKAFMDEARANGHQVKHLDAVELHIKGCNACDACYSKGVPCVFDDNFNAIADDILSADVIVLCAPVYFYTFPTQMKAVLDKFYAFAIGRKTQIRNKQWALISCCEEKPMSTFFGLEYPYERAIKGMCGTSIGEVLVPGVFKTGAIVNTDGEARARALADLL